LINVVTGARSDREEWRRMAGEASDRPDVPSAKGT
jgi:hypothetical protein